ALELSTSIGVVDRLRQSRANCVRNFVINSFREDSMRAAGNEPLARHALAFVLAGGRGSRLLELTDRRAKPAVYFGGKSRIIDFALSNAMNSGIRRIAVATQYKAHSLIRHLQMGWNFFRPERNESFDFCRPASAFPRRTGISGRRTQFTKTSTSSSL